MKKSTFSPAKIAGVLKEFAGGRSAEELARENGISTREEISDNVENECIYTIKKLENFTP